MLSKGQQPQPQPGERQQPQPPSVFHQCNQTLTMQKGLFSPPRCRQSPVPPVHRPRLSPVCDDSKSFSVAAFFWGGRVHSGISALPTHLSAEDKVVMICQDQFVLENCHSRLLQQKRSGTKLVMFRQVKFGLKSHRSVGNF